MLVPMRKVIAMNSIEEKLKQAKQIAQDAQTKRIQLETKLEAAQAKKAELLDKCKQLGVKPDELSARIIELEVQIQEGLKTLEDILPSSGLDEESNPPW